MDFISDLDTNDLGQFGIEWDGDYGRHWQWFETEAEREAALKTFESEQMERELELYEDERMNRSVYETDSDNFVRPW